MLPRHRFNFNPLFSIVCMRMECRDLIHRFQIQISPHLGDFFVRFINRSR